MASLRKRSGSRNGWLIEFYDSDKKQRSIWLGPIGVKARNEVLRHVEELLRAKILNQLPDPQTELWVHGLDAEFRGRLVRHGLTVPVAKRSVTSADRQLGIFTRWFIDQMTDAQPRTKKNYDQTRSWLIKHFGESRDIGTITPEDMKRWQRSLRASESLNSVANRNKHLQRAKTFFRSAVNDRIIAESPASVLKDEKLPGGRRLDRSRHQFVDETRTEQVLRGLKGRWKLLFALLRYQGLRRCEVAILAWSNVDWARRRLQIHSPKTGYRECPIFPPVWDLLNEAFELAVEQAGDKPLNKSSSVISWVGSEDNITPMLRTRVAAILGADHVWPKICTQLRSTRRTELEESFPAHVCDDWLGHDDETARRHYKQVTPTHWENATKLGQIGSVAGSVVSDTQGLSASLTPKRKTQKPLEIVAFPGVAENEPIPRRGVSDSNVSPNKTLGENLVPAGGSVAGSVIPENPKDHQRLENQHVSDGASLMFPGDPAGGLPIPMTRADYPRMRRAIELLRRMTTAEQDMELDRWQKTYG
jgi:integrase